MPVHQMLLLALTVGSSQASLLRTPWSPKALAQTHSRSLWEAYEAERKRGFSSRASALPVADRLLIASNAAAVDPCGADLLANGLNHPYGFGARAMMLADELQLAAYFNVSVAVCDGNAEEPGIEWSRHFQNPTGLVLCTDLEACSTRRSDAAHLGSIMSKELREVDHGFQSRLKRELYSALFAYSPEMQARVDAALIAAGLEPGARYIGVHVRRGDKRITRGLPAKEYALKVAQALHSHGLHDVFVASDDPGAVDELRLLLAPEVPGVRLVQAYSPTSADRAYDGDEDETMLALLTDLEALRRAEVFVGSRKSYTSRTAYFLRGEKPSTSIDGDWLKGVDLMADGRVMD